MLCTQVASTMSAKKPITTDGMPAKSSMTGLTISRSRRRANSETYTAASDAERRADEQRNERDLERSDHQRNDVVLGHVADGLPHVLLGSVG